MNYATNIALVDKTTNTVSNVIWGMIYQMEEFNTEKYEAVSIGNLGVSIGDIYDGSNFVHNGEAVTDQAAELADAQAALELLGVKK